MTMLETKNLVKVIEFWQKTVGEEKLFSRELVKEVDCRGKEVVDIVGPRRSGKSSVLYLLMKKLVEKGNGLYVNFEDPFFINNNQPAILGEIIDVYKEYFSQNLRYLFLDEIQNIEQWERAVRKLRDSGKYKIFVTGSSSKLLASEIASLLTGRHLSYQLFPLSFAEFLFFRNLIILNKKQIILQEKNLNKRFEEYLNIGGFPEVVLTGNLALLKNYFFDILQKDIAGRHEVRDKKTLEKVAVYLMSNAAKTISLAEIKRTFNLSFAAASAYLNYFQEAFLLMELPQFAYSLKSQHKALKKIYAIDTGLASAVSFRFSEDRGRLIEQVVFLQLKRKQEELYYYKTKKGREVDFLVKKGARQKELIQVTWSLGDRETAKREIGVLIEAMEELALREALIVTFEESDKIVVGDKVIFVKPVCQWILEGSF